MGHRAVVTVASSSAYVVVLVRLLVIRRRSFVTVGLEDFLKRRRDQSAFVFWVCFIPIEEVYCQSASDIGNGNIK